MNFWLAVWHIEVNKVERKLSDICWLCKWGMQTLPPLAYLWYLWRGGVLNLFIRFLYLYQIANERIYLCICELYSSYILRQCTYYHWFSSCLLKIEMRLTPIKFHIHSVKYQIRFLRKLPYSMLFSVRHYRDWPPTDVEMWKIILIARMIRRRKQESRKILKYKLLDEYLTSQVDFWFENEAMSTR